VDSRYSSTGHWSTGAGLTDTGHSNGGTPSLLARFTYRPWAPTPACVLIVAGSAFWGLAQQRVPHLALGHRDSWARPAVSQPVGRLPQLDRHFLDYAILSLPWDAFHALLRLSVSWFRRPETARIMGMPPHPGRGNNDCGHAAGMRKARPGAFTALGRASFRGADSRQPIRNPLRAKTTQASSGGVHAIYI
jgi:hypothetical protein